MIHRTRKRSPRRGAAVVELAILAPVILALVVGLWEVGRIIEIQQVLSNACREGARQAATGQLSDAEVKLVVSSYIQNALQNQQVSLANVQVYVTAPSATPATAPALDPSGPDIVQLTPIQVSATIPCNDIKWIALDYVIPSGRLLAAQSIWYSVKNKEYADVDDPAIE